MMQMNEKPDNFFYFTFAKYFPITMKFSKMPEFSKVAIKAISLPLYNWFI